MGYAWDMYLGLLLLIGYFAAPIQVSICMGRLWIRPIRRRRSREQARRGGAQPHRNGESATGNTSTQRSTLLGSLALEAEALLLTAALDGAEAVAATVAALGLSSGCLSALLSILPAARSTGLGAAGGGAGLGMGGAVEGVAAHAAAQ
jgi:hypothetical protein